eukprot:3619774-Rhodomonas_salina.3
MSEHQVNADRSRRDRHICTRRSRYWLLNMVRERILKLRKVAGTQNVADALTKTSKSLPSGSGYPSFSKHCKYLHTDTGSLLFYFFQHQCPGRSCGHGSIFTDAGGPSRGRAAWACTSLHRAGGSQPGEPESERVQGHWYWHSLESREVSCDSGIT